MRDLKQAVIEELKGYIVDPTKAISEYEDDVFNYNSGLKTAIQAIEELLPSDVVEVKHGKWIDRYNDGDWHCSICGAIVEKDEQTYRNWYWCYHCGADMREESDNEVV